MAIPEWMRDVYNNTFLSIYTQQSWADLAVWERFLKQYEPAHIIELGTFNGGMSVFLLAQAKRRGLGFHTFDNVKRFATERYLTSELEHYFTKADIFDAIGTAQVLEHIDRPDPIVLLCDNGNKPREVATFRPHLQPGDFLAVHDWGVEIAAHEMKPHEEGLERILWADCEEAKSVTRFWRVID